jgi:hypothetical protein
MGASFPLLTGRSSGTTAIATPDRPVIMPVFRLMDAGIGREHSESGGHEPGAADMRGEAWPNSGRLAVHALFTGLRLDRGMIEPIMALANRRRSLS